MSKVANVALNRIRLDGGTQQRPLDLVAVEEYAERIKDGDEPPPGEAIFDGTDLWLVDGFHRYHAARKANAKTLKLTITRGTKRDAVWRSFAVNKSHGVRRQPGVVRQIIETILADPEWAIVPQGEIAEHVGTARRYVVRIAAETRRASWDQSQDAQVTPPFTKTVERNGKRYEMEVGRIGKRPDGSDRDAGAEVVCDKAGNRVQDSSVAAVFRRLGEIDERIRILREQDREIGEAVKNGDPLYAFLSPVVTAVQNDIRRAINHMIAKAPYAICPTCVDDPLSRRGCKTCHEAGFVVRLVYDGTPKSLREAIGKRGAA